MRHTSIAVYCLLFASLMFSQIICSLPVSYPDGVLIDKVQYDRTVVYRAQSMNIVSDLRQGDFDNDGTDEILVLAADGIRLLTLEGKEKRLTPFRSPESPWAVRFVAGTVTGNLRVLGNLPKAQRTVLFDESGIVLWSADGTPWGEPVAADLYGDNHQEFVIKSGDGGIAQLSMEGVLVGKITGAGQPLFYDCADMNGDGRSELILEDYVNGRNEIRILSGDGKELAHWTSPHLFYRFAVARAAGDEPQSIIILSDDAEELVFLDMAGKVLRTLKAPWGNHLATPRGMPIRVAGDKGFVCLATSKGSNHHHIVYVYGAGGDLVYADSVADDAGALLVSRNAMDNGQVPSFLVGGRNIIWKYTEKR